MKNSKPTRYIRVAIIEDDPLRVAGFHAILDRYTDLRISAVSLLELASPNTADVLILQERRIGLSITIEHVRSVWPRVPIVVTASALSKEVIVDALRRGARGCIQENSAPDEFARAIRVISEGLVWAPRSALAALIEHYHRDDAQIRGSAHLHSVKASVGTACRRNVEQGNCRAPRYRDTYR